MRRRAAFAIIALLAIYFCSAARASADRTVFVVVLSRHSVRNPTKPIPGYLWPAWYTTPRSDGFLSKRGYLLARDMGAFELDYVHRLGLLRRGDCSNDRIFAWADIEQRTMESAHAMLAAFEDPAMCAPGVPLGHAIGFDPLFHSAEASRAVTVARVNKEDMQALQSLLASRCLAACTPPPPAVASSAAENVFLEFAQCRPLDEIAHGVPNVEELLMRSLRIHVLTTAIERRERALATEYGANLLAHIVAMLDAKAGRRHPFADAPEMEGTAVALLMAHDANIANLAGLLEAHWRLGDGMPADDIPPASALVFELHEVATSTYEVRLRFVAPTLAQFRSARKTIGGALIAPVEMGDCAGAECRIPLQTLEGIVESPAASRFIERAWPRADPAEPRYPPLEDPAWTRCN